MNTENPETIKIGSISALTGVGIAIGEEERKGAELAVEDVNNAGGVAGKKLELISEDVSIDKIKIATNVANKLINVDKVVAIVGPQWDEPALPILPIIEKSKVVMIGPDSSLSLESEHSYEYFFSTWYDNKVGIRELLRFAEAKQLNKIVIIKPIAAGFWEYTSKIMQDEAGKYGVNIVDVVDLGNPLSLDFRTTIAKINKMSPDAIFIVTSDYNQCAFLRQLSELGYRGVTLGTESSGDPISLTQCPVLLEKRFFSTPANNQNYSVFAEKFKAKFGTYPKYPSAATAYDAVKVIADGLNRTGGIGGDRLRITIAESNIVGGVGLENIKFDDRGFIKTPETAFEIRTTKDGLFTKVNYVE